MILDDFVNTWRSLIPEGYFKPSTLANYESHLRCHILPLLGPREVDSISILDSQKYIVSLQQKGLSAKSVRNSVMVLRVLWKSAVPWGYASKNPWNGLMLPRVHAKGKVIFTMQELSRIIGTARPPFNLFFWLAAETGMRAGELCALGVDDVDYSEAKVFVRKSLWSGKIQLPKTKNAVRTCAISSALAKALQVYVVQSRLRGNHSDSVRFLFVTERGYPWNPSAVVSRVLHPLLADLGMASAGIHAFRHTSATLADKNGLPLKDRQLRLGHADARITLDTYTHASGISDAEKSFVGKIGEEIGKTVVH